MKITAQQLYNARIIDKNIEKELKETQVVEFSLKAKKDKIIAKAELLSEYKGIDKGTAIKAVRSKKDKTKLKYSSCIKKRLKHHDDDKQSFSIAKNIVKDMVKNKELLKIILQNAKKK